MMTLSNEKLSILANHYQSSVQNIKDDIKARDWYFGLVLLIFIGILTRVVDLSTFVLILDKATSLPISNLEKNTYIRCAMWSACFYFFMKYSQKHIMIERGYRYIKKLELQLSSHFNNSAYTLESSYYKNDHSITREVNSFFFKKLIPLLLLTILTSQLTLIFESQVNLLSTIESLLIVSLAIYIIIFTFEA